MKFVTADIETDGLLEELTKIHCLSMNWGGSIRTTFDYEKIKELVQREDIVLVGHNFVTYDVPALEKVLGVKVKCQIADTLGLAWYLYPGRKSYGLESFGEDFGIEKPPITDWQGLDREVYKYRCESDVRINMALWDKIWTDLHELYDNDTELVMSFIRYISFKMHTVRLMEENPFKLDIKKCEENLQHLNGLKEEKISALKQSMPTVAVKSERKPPAKPYKQDGTLSATGLKWKKLTDEHGLPFGHNEPIIITKDYDEPNPDSPQQIKDWLLSLGWKPQTFSDGANGKVPQVYTQDKSLCPSVLKLADPAIEHLEGLGVLKHRIGLLKGFLRDQRGGYLKQSIAGFTSTLRMRHRYIVNLPKPSVPFGELIRGVLTCDEGKVICGSDLAGLEERTKMHYIYPLDPKYVESMMEDGYDGHLALAQFAGALTKEQVDAHKRKEEDHGETRHVYKQVNYMCTYSVGAKSLAVYLGISIKEAQQLINSYWDMNWSVKHVAQTWKTKECLGRQWIQNPLNKYWYELRSEKDRFSAVNQSTGAYIFDLWVKFMTDRGVYITLQSHDEVGIICDPDKKEWVNSVLRESIEKVNKCLKLNRTMDIDIKWGDYYSNVH